MVFNKRAKLLLGLIGLVNCVTINAVFFGQDAAAWDSYGGRAISWTWRRIKNWRPGDMNYQAEQAGLRLRDRLNPTRTIPSEAAGSQRVDPRYLQPMRRPIQFGQ